MSEIDAALMEKMEDYNKKVEKIDLELGKFFISFFPIAFKHGTGDLAYKATAVLLMTAEILIY